RCEEESLVFGFAHNHPTGYPEFSEVDDANELTLLSAISNRNGRAITFIALLWAGRWTARVRSGHKPTLAVDAQHVLVTDRPLRVDKRRGAGSIDSAYSRQVAAFGAPFTEILRGLRIAVVGAGGTGSPTATLLARSGVGELVLIDPDVLEES